MALYQKQFAIPYPGGYVDKPQKTTPVTAEILNMLDNTLAALEEFLTSDDIKFRNKLTAGSRAPSSSEGDYSLVAGLMGTASGRSAIALGSFLQATGNESVALGNGTISSGSGSVAMGINSKATGMASISMGNNAQASGSNSCAEGVATIASGQNQFVQGMYNVADTENKYAHIVGGGNNKERKNIYALDWYGNAEFAGDITNGNGVSLDGLMGLIGSTGQLRTIVDALPEEDISTNTIYMVPKDTGGDNDIYNEYINVDGTPDGWEFIGNSSVDLSNYYTKFQVDEILLKYVPAESGKGLSSNDYTDVDRDLVESIRNMTAADAMTILNGEAE